MPWNNKSFNVSVTNGSGSNTFSITDCSSGNGSVESIFINPPSGSPTLDYEIADANNATRDARSGITAPALIKMNFILSGTNTFRIANATVNGTYVVTWYYEYTLIP